MHSIIIMDPEGMLGYDDNLIVDPKKTIGSNYKQASDTHKVEINNNALLQGPQKIPQKYPEPTSSHIMSQPELKNEKPNENTRPIPLQSSHPVESSVFQINEKRSSAYGTQRKPINPALRVKELEEKQKLKISSPSTVPPDDRTDINRNENQLSAMPVNNNVIPQIQYVKEKTDQQTHIADASPAEPPHLHNKDLKGENLLLVVSAAKKVGPPGLYLEGKNAKPNTAIPSPPKLTPNKIVEIKQEPPQSFDFKTNEETKENSSQIPPHINPQEFRLKPQGFPSPQSLAPSAAVQKAINPHELVWKPQGCPSPPSLAASAAVPKKINTQGFAWKPKEDSKSPSTIVKKVINPHPVRNKDLAKLLKIMTSHPSLRALEQNPTIPDLSLQVLLADTPHGLVQSLLVQNITCADCSNFRIVLHLSCGHDNCYHCIRSRATAHITAPSLKTFKKATCSVCRISYSFSDIQRVFETAPELIQKFQNPGIQHKCARCQLKLDLNKSFFSELSCLHMCCNCYADDLFFGCTECSVCSAKYQFSHSSLSREVTCVCCEEQGNFVKHGYRLAHGEHILCFDCGQDSVLENKCKSCQVKLGRKQCRAIRVCLWKLCSVCSKSVSIIEINRKKNCCRFHVCMGCFDGGENNALCLLCSWP